MPGERRNILSPFTQRWQGNFNRVQTKQKIFAKSSRQGFSPQVRIRRRKHPHVHLLRLRRSHSLQFACLQHPQ